MIDPTPAHVACGQAGTWAAWAEVAHRQGVSYIDKIYIFEIIMKNCSKYVSASQIGWNFLKVGTPNISCIAIYVILHRLCQMCHPLFTSSVINIPEPLISPKKKLKNKHIRYWFPWPLTAILHKSKMGMTEAPKIPQNKVL